MRRKEDSYKQWGMKNVAENVTDFYPESEDTLSFGHGKLSLKSDDTIMNADESIYAFLKRLSALPFPGLAHPEDADCVRKALADVHETGEPQCVTFRMQGGDEKYRYVYAKFSKHEREWEDMPCVDVELIDIIRIGHLYDLTKGRVEKYRKLMSLSDKMYFEYRYSDGMISIYEYINNRSNDLFAKKLEDFREEIATCPDYSFKQKAEFETLCDHLTNRMENMDVEMEVDSRLFGLDRGYLLLRGSAAYHDNRKELFVATITVCKEAKSEKKYYKSVYARDGGTGLYNKRAIAELAMETIDNAKDAPVFLCILDVDDFKNINDSYGHLAGDEIIAKVAEVINNNMAGRGFAGRFGGDEFLIVADRVKNADEFILMLKTMRKTIAYQCAEMYRGLNVTTSAGIAEYPKDASDYEELFKLADKCLYLAKAKGKNRYIIYVEEKHKDFHLYSTEQKDSKVYPVNAYDARCRQIVDTFNRMAGGTREGLDNAVQYLMKSFDIDRITVYGGDEYQLKYSMGDCGGLMQRADYLEDERGKALFDESGLYTQNQSLPLKEKFPELYDKLKAQGTEGYHATKISGQDGCEMLVTFEILRRFRKWSSNERGLLYITAQFIGKCWWELEKTNNRSNDKGEES